MRFDPILRAAPMRRLETAPEDWAAFNAADLRRRMGGLRASPHSGASKGGVHALTKWLTRRAAPHGVPT